MGKFKKKLQIGNGIYDMLLGGLHSHNPPGIYEAKNGYATFEGPSYEKHYDVADTSKNCGIIDSPGDVGGWPELKSKPAPKDTDHDGMPDAWEDENNLNKNDSNDRNNMGTDGYTMLEQYLNNIK